MRYNTIVEAIAPISSILQKILSITRDGISEYHDGKHAYSFVTKFKREI